MHENQKVRGLTKRNGVWHINKVIDGARIYESTRTTDYDEAVSLLDHKMAILKRKMIRKEWKHEVEAAYLDSNSWLSRMRYQMRRKRDRGPIMKKDELKRLAILSNGECAISKLRFNFEKIGPSFRSPFMPSIDRIDSSNGYSLENCRLVCLIVNIALSDWGDEAVLKMSKAIISEHLRDDF